MTRDLPRRADARRNRERLVAAATDLFARHGIDVPLEDIARAAGLSIGTLYNNFPNRGALLDVVIPERLAALETLASDALKDSDPWTGFTLFLEGMFTLQARDRAINEAISRNPLGAVDVSAECGRAGGVLDSVVTRVRESGHLRPDFGPDDLTTLVWAMSKVISMSNGDDSIWRRHLHFVLEGLRPQITTNAPCMAPAQSGEQSVC